MPRQFVLFGRSSSLLLMIFYKVLLAGIQVLAGALFLIVAFFIKHPTIIDAIQEIADKDRFDQAAYWIIEQFASWKIEYVVLVNVGLVLISLGLFSLIVAGGLWFKSSKMRLLALLIFGAIALYSSYQLILHFSVLQAIVLAVDIYILYYFWHILPRHINR
jgi:hypothetical protein